MPMKFVDNIYNNTLEIKQSKFMAYLMPYSQYKDTLQSLKESNPKARHFVVAYRYLNEFEQIVEFSSDDGEPKGTSGKPTLMVLQGEDLINSAIITVRYFGGTKLGTGGLVRAYSDATNEVIRLANLMEYKKQIYITISFEYTHLRQIEYDCLACGIDIVDKIFSNDTIYKLRADEKSMDAFLEKVKRIVNIE